MNLPTPMERSFIYSTLIEEEGGVPASSGGRACAPSGLSLASESQAEPLVPNAKDMFQASVKEILIDDVTHIIQRVPYIERYPASLWDAGLVDELADVSDRLAAKVAQLQEALGADR